MKINKLQLNEMALKKVDAIDKCQQLGWQFINHFHKLYKESSNSSTFHHHCSEMQSWLNTVRSYKLKSTNKFLTSVDLIDWFFTACGGVDADNDFTSDEADYYDEFITKLLYDKTISVEEAAQKTLEAKLN